MPYGNNFVNLQYRKKEKINSITNYKNSIKILNFCIMKTLFPKISFIISQICTACACVVFGFYLLTAAQISAHNLLGALFVGFCMICAICIPFITISIGVAKFIENETKK